MEKKTAAIKEAVRTALLSVGLDRLRSEEFFGTGQKVDDV